MPHYPDLTKCDYFGVWDDVLLAVGWLEEGEPFPTGAVSEEFFDILSELASRSVQRRTVGFMMGRHHCTICRQAGIAVDPLFYAGNRRVAIGQYNLFVPDKGPAVFVAPTYILHYIAVHNYCPPAAFQEAVLACPTMGSRKYYREMRNRGAAIWSWWTFAKLALGGFLSGLSPPPARMPKPEEKGSEENR